MLSDITAPKPKILLAWLSHVMYNKQLPLDSYSKQLPLDSNRYSSGYGQVCCMVGQSVACCLVKLSGTETFIVSDALEIICRVLQGSAGQGPPHAAQAPLPLSPLFSLHLLCKLLTCITQICLQLTSFYTCPYTVSVIDRAPAAFAELYCGLTNKA